MSSGIDAQRRESVSEPVCDNPGALVDGCDVDAPGYTVSDPSKVPGGLLEQRWRETPSGIVDFEYAPAGFLTKKGEPRRVDYRAYWWTPTGSKKRQRMVSVTTLLDAILPKPGLVPWSEARGIEGAVMAMRFGEITELTDPADGVKIVRDLKLGADRASKRAADRGVNVHALLEEYMRTGQPPALGDHPVEHHGYISSLCGWLLKRNPEPVSIEDLVCDPVAGYAGRSDLVALCDGVRIRFDAKTSDKAAIYSSAHLQTALYERGAVACGDEPTDEQRIVVFPADGAEAREMPCEATHHVVDAALMFYEAIKPIESLCASQNAFERKARR